MRAGTRLFGSTFTDAYLQFPKSQKANFHVCIQLLVCLIYLMQQNSNLAFWGFMNCQSCYFFMRKYNLGQFGLHVTFEQKRVRRPG